MELGTAVKNVCCGKEGLWSGEMRGCRGIGEIELSTNPGAALFQLVHLKKDLRKLYYR